MTKKEIKELKSNHDARLNNILSNGKKIGYLPSIPKNKYYLLDNVIWYVPYGSYPICEGSLRFFKEKINKNMVRIKLIMDIDEL